MVLLFVFGCAPETTVPGACGMLSGIEAPVQAAPGSAVAIEATGSGGDVAWTSEAGAFTVADDRLTEWIAPDLADPDKKQKVTLTATATSPGCVDEALSVEVTVDWTDAERTLVVYNPNVEGSEDVASYYQAFRGIPDQNLCPIPAEDPNTLDAGQYESWITAMQGCADALSGRILYVVPVWGVPYQVMGRIDDLAGSGAKWTVSLDALAHLGIESLDYESTIYAPLYQNGVSRLGQYDPYRSALVIRRSDEVRADFPHLYLVARIDGATAEDAKTLVDRTAEAEALAAAGALAGTVYVDARFGETPPATDAFGSYESGDWNMWGTRAVFEDLGWYPVVWDSNEAELGTAPAPTACPDALYYAGWYQFYNYNDCFDWVPGAIGGHLDSCSACSFRQPGSWAAGALADGITATFGAVNEPYVAGMPEYDQFFLYLTSGASFGEAAYESTVVGLWMMVWIGDPLYRPYPDGADAEAG